ncbi:MAG TPA: hypothetical protein VFU40_06910, partial [Gemmatimonadales bacterium]|nr:hypothetical protein [Gemmatimonadales bacterium]
DDGLVLAVANALRGEVYAAAYRFGVDRVVTELAPSVRRLDEVVHAAFRPTVVVGEAPPEIAAALADWAGQPVIGPPAGAPHAAQLLTLVGRAGGASRVDNVPAWEPVYGRPAEAQARWEMAHGRRLPDSVGSPR